MSYLGYVDEVGKRFVRGWAYDTTHPDDAVTVELIVNGAPVIAVKADRYREDLFHAGIGGGCHAFEIAIAIVYPPEGIRVRVKGAECYLVNSYKKKNKSHFERLNNSILDGIPRLKVGFTSKKADDRDKSVALEIIAQWRRLAGAPQANSPARGDMWDCLVASNGRRAG